MLTVGSDIAITIDPLNTRLRMTDLHYIEDDLRDAILRHLLVEFVTCVKPMFGCD
jgi:hypothetical protein